MGGPGRGRRRRRAEEQGRDLGGGCLVAILILTAGIFASVILAFEGPGYVPVAAWSRGLSP